MSVWCWVLLGICVSALICLIMSLQTILNINNDDNIENNNIKIKEEIN